MPVLCICAYCGKQLRKEPYYGRSARSYCNRDCQKADRSLERRFWRNVQCNIGGCWVWTGDSVLQNYGVIYYQKKSWRTSRLIWTMMHGSIPDGLFVCHKCDNPRCVNPAHLFLGTHDDNVADKVAKSRQARGEGFGRSKLTDDAVREIRSLYASGVNSVEIGKRFGIDKSTAWAVIKRVTWKHVD
jgi:hypothetical protein